MAFRGDASQIPVSNIVQALFMNSQEGVLTIRLGNVRRNLRIIKAGIRPLAGSPGGADLLGLALVKERILSEAEFQNVMSTWDSSERFPGDFLVRRGLVTGEQVESNVRRQLEELIFDVFAATDLSYEFRADEEWLDHELFSPEGLGKSLVYSVNGVLMESVRRQDDWRRISQAIRSEHEAFVSSSSSLPRSPPDNLDVSPEVYQGTRKLLSETRTVGSIIAESPWSSYKVHHVLFKLLEAGLIRRVDATEKEQLAEKLRRKMKVKDAIALYRSVLADDPANTRVRKQLIAQLEKESRSRPEQLVEHYSALVDQHQGEPSKALHFADKILQIDPRHLATHEKRISLLFDGERREAAMSATRTLVKVSKESGAPAEGAQVLRRLLEKHPEDPFLLHHVSDLFLAAGNRDAAVRHLKSLADIYERNGELQKLRKTYEIVVQADPSERPRMKRILAESRKRGRSPFAVLRTALVFAGAGIALAAGAYLALGELQSRRLWAQTVRCVESNLERGQFETAREIATDFGRVCPYSTRKYRISDLLQRIETKEDQASQIRRKHAEDVNLTAGSALARAESLQSRGQHERAFELLTTTLEDLRRSGVPAVARSHVERIEERLRHLRTYFGRAEKLARRTRKAKESGEVSKAHDLTVKLLERYPHTPAAKAALIPVLIQARPDGATVTINGTEVGHKTPLVADLPPREVAVIRISRRGFEPKAFRIDPMRTAEIMTSLVKDDLWRFDSGAPIEAYPVTLGSDIVFANRNGTVYCLTANGRKRWAFQIPGKSDVSGGLGLWNNTVYAGSHDGRVYRINATSGTPQGPPVLASQSAVWIKEAPSQASSEGVAVFNCGGRIISGVDLVGGAVAWTYEAPSRLVGPPLSWNDRVHLPASDGRVLRFLQNDGEPLPPLDLPGVPTHGGPAADGKMWLVIETSIIVCLSIEEGQILWSRDLEERVTAAPSVDSTPRRVVVALDSPEAVCLDAQSGQLEWRSPLSAPVETRGVVFRNAFYVGTLSGEITCFDTPSGSLLWSFSTGGTKESPPRSILCPGLVHKGRFIQGSDDGFLYCLTY